MGVLNGWEREALEEAAAVLLENSPLLLKSEHYSPGELANSPDQFKDLEEILLVTLMIL